MFFTCFADEIKSDINKALRAEEKQLYKTHQEIQKDIVQGDDCVKFQVTKQGGYIKKQIQKAAQIYINHKGKISWRRDRSLNIHYLEAIKMTQNFLRAGGQLTPLEMYFHNMHSDTNKKVDSYEETVFKYGHEVGGYKDVLNRPKNLYGFNI